MVGRSWARRCFSKHPAVVSASMDRVGHKAIPSRWSLLWKEEPGLCAVVGDPCFMEFLPVWTPHKGTGRLCSAWQIKNNTAVEGLRSSHLFLSFIMKIFIVYVQPSIFLHLQGCRRLEPIPAGVRTHCGRVTDLWALTQGDRQPLTLTQSPVNLT